MLLAVVLGALAFTGHAKPQTYLLDVPGRFQYDDRNGFCGEVSIQMLMLEYGIWIPQETARSAGSSDPYSDLLPGENYNKALRRLKIRHDEFKGKGYKSFIRWAKKHLMKGSGVVEVAYIKGGQFSEYDHVMPIVGIRTSTKSYSDKDVLYVHTNYARRPVQRRVGDYWCTRAHKKDSYTKGGCIPLNTKWGHALKGPKYLGIGPKVELSVSSSAEPGLGRSKTFKGKATIRGLDAGREYVLYQITRLDKVPDNPGARIGGAAKKVKFKATKAEHTVQVTFPSRTPAYFICVPLRSNLSANSTE